MYKIIGADGNQYGPVPLEELKSWVRDRRANGDTMVQGPGMTDWRPMRTFSEFSDVLGVPVATQVYPAPTPMQPAQKINDYLVPAILVTLCCCLPAGVVAIVYAAQAKSKSSIGDWAGAQEAADKAKTWTWVSFIVGGLVSLAYVAIVALGGMK